MKPSLYLDYCATTPVHADVRAAMLMTLEDDFGNPSSMHEAGRIAANLLSQARNEVAQSLNCKPEEIIFTSGATEADNLALMGVMRLYPAGKAHLITSSIEHHAILHTARQLECEGYLLTVLPVNSQGLVDPQDVRKAIRPETKLISIMLVNNEVGSIQPLAEIGEIARDNEILFHSDAVQGMWLLNVDVNVLKLDLLSLSAHKIYGPKGIGALYVRTGVQLEPMFHGGSQERAIRPGTENVPGIVGLGAALRLVGQHKQQEWVRLAQLRKTLIHALEQRIPGLIVNGPAEVSPHVLSLSFPGAIGEMMLLRLNSLGVAVSMGSACTSKDIEPSHVLTAMGLPRSQIEGTLRISLGTPTTAADLEALMDILPDVWRKAKLEE